MTRIAFGAAFAALALAMPAAAVAQRSAAPILIVDTDRILSSCTACVAANTQLHTILNNANARKQQLSAPLEQEAQSLEQAAKSVQAMPAGPARTQKEADLRAPAQQLEDRQAAANEELDRLDKNLQSTRANVTRQLGERIVQISNQIMTQRGAEAVFSKGASLASADSVDITSEVLTALNQQLPAVSVTPMPQPPQTQGR